MTPTVRAKLIRIGNSRGVRIPRAMLEQVNLLDDVDLSVDGTTLVIQSAHQPRKGWAEEFARMAQANNDRPLDGYASLAWDANCRELVVNRFDVFEVEAPEGGFKALVLSPNEMGHKLAMVLVAPLVSPEAAYAMRPLCQLGDINYAVALDQMSSVVKTRLTSKLGEIKPSGQIQIVNALTAFFAR